MATTIANLLIKLDADTTNVSKGFANVQKAALAVGAAVTGIAVAGVKAFSVQDKAEKSLLVALKGREDVQKRLLNQASEFQKVSLFGDEQIIQQQSFLASLKLSEEQINNVLAAAIDLSAGTGTTLESAVKNLAKTFGGLTGELGESIPQLKNLTTEQLKSGDAIALVAEQFRGQGKAAADAGLGPLKQFQNAAGDILEIVGKALTPALQEGARVLTSLAEKIQNAAGGEVLLKLQAGFLTVVKSLGLFAESGREAIGPILGLFNGAKALTLVLQGKFSEAWSSAKKAVNEFAKPFTGILKIGSRVSEVIDTYKTTLNDLKTKTDPVIQSQTTLGTTMGNLGKEVKKVAEEFRLLNVDADKTFKLITSIGTGAVISDEDFTKKFLPGAPPLPAEEEQQDLDILGQRRAQLQGLVSDYTNLQEPLAAYIESLKTVEAIQNAINTSTELFGSTLLAVADATVEYAKSGGSSLKEFARVAAQAARQNIGNFIREGVAAAVKSALASVPFPFNIALAGIAGALAQTLFNKLISSLKIPAFGDGGLVTKPTLALVGEKGPELITPVRDLAGGGLTVNVRGEIEGNKLKLLMDQQDRIGHRKFG